MLSQTLYVFLCVYQSANITQFRYAEMLPIAHLRQCDPQTTAQEMFMNLSLPITKEMMLMIYIPRSESCSISMGNNTPKMNPASKPDSSLK